LPSHTRFEDFIFLDKKSNKVVLPAPEPPIIAKASPDFKLPDTFDRIFFGGFANPLEHFP